MIKFIILPDSVVRNKKLNATDKLLYGLLRFYAKNGDISTARMASELSTSRAAISRAIQKLEKSGIIRVTTEYKKINQYEIPDINDDNFLIITSDILQAGITAAAKLVYAYLKFRTGDNTETWPHQKTIAAELGISRASILRILADLEDNHYLQIKHAHGGRRQGNRYRPTEKLFIDTKCSAKSKSGAAKRYANNNTNKELKRKETHMTNNFPLKKLFFKPENPQFQAYRALLSERVIPKVAHSLIFDQFHPPDSIFAAIQNAYTAAETKRQAGIAFNIPAYIVGSLNAARQQGHIVKPSKETKKAKTKLQNLKMIYKVHDEYEPNNLITDKSQREQWIENQKRRLLA